MTTIADLQGSVTTYINSLESQATTAIGRLSDTAATWSYSTVSPVGAITISSPSSYAGTKPALGTLSIDALLTETLAAAETLTVASLGALTTFTATDFTALTSPSLPAAPAGASTAPVWNEAFWSDLKSRVSAILSSITGSDDVDSLVTKLTGDSTRIQDAIFAADYERKSQTLRDVYSAADSSTGAKGFTYPNSMTTALKLDAQQKYQFDLAQVGRDLVKTVYEWARGNYQFAVQQGVSIHGADTEFNIRYAEAAIQTYTATLNGLMEKYRSDVTLLISKADANIRQYTAQISAQIDAYRVQNDVAIKAYAEKTDASVKRFNASSDADLRGYREKADVAVASARLLKEIQREDQRLDVEIARVNATITEEDMRIRISDYAERVRAFTAATEENIKILDENVKNKIASASAVVQGVAALAQNATQTTVGILTATGT